ncbi:MAG: type II secretion system minor pseudopilin GspK [Betaproteobacteria bacterium]|jgi:general secretion pathway protein K
MKPQRGVAVVLALAVLAIVALVVSDLLLQARVTLHAARNGGEQSQLRLVALAGSDWARQVLDEDARAGTADTLDEPWALRLPPTPAEGGEVGGSIEDQQARFNLNNLAPGGVVDARALGQFRRLLGLLGIDPALAEAIADWIDSDREPSGSGGAEAEFYARLSPPVQPADRMLVEVSDLGAVRGLTPAVRARLAPFVAALPGRTVVNVNTATPEVLSATIDGLSLPDALEVVARRRREPFLQTAQFVAALPPAFAGRSTRDLGVGSAFFMIEVEARRQEVSARLRSLVVRDPGMPARVLHHRFL